MRDVKPEKPSAQQNLFRTASMALLIGSIMSLAAMFWALTQIAPTGAGLDYYLPWGLPYGILDVLLAGAGLFFSIEAKDKPKLLLPGLIVDLVGGCLILLQGIPIGIFLSHVEFCVSVMVIGACVGIIALVGISAVRHPDQE